MKTLLLSLQSQNGGTQRIGKQKDSKYLDYIFEDR